MINLEKENVNIYEEAEEVKTKYNQIVASEIERVSKFTYANFDELLKMIFENCSDIAEIESCIDILRQEIIKSQDTIDRMNYQKTMTRRDIIEENFINIFTVYSAGVLGTYLLSSDPMTFIKKFIIIALIGVTTFKINLDYFTSDYRKKQITEYVTNLSSNITDNKFYVSTLTRLKEMSSKELEYQVMKLYEIVKNNDNYELDYEKIDTFLKGINIDCVFDDKVVKTKVRRK